MKKKRKAVYFRFANYKDFDTLSQHQEILRVYDKKKVYWGIWKKEYEHFQRDNTNKSWKYSKRFYDEPPFSEKVIYDNDQLFLLNNVY